MKLSTRARYGTGAVLDLALHYGEGLISLKDVARRQQISGLYLEQLILPLKAAGVVISARGAHGGYALAKPAAEIKLTEIVQALEGPITLADCIDDPKVCSRSGVCVTRDLWSEMGKAMNGVLEATTLQDLVSRQRQKGDPNAMMYYI